MGDDWPEHAREFEVVSGNSRLGHVLGAECQGVKATPKSVSANRCLAAQSRLVGCVYFHILYSIQHIKRYSLFTSAPV